MGSLKGFGLTVVGIHRFFFNFDSNAVTLHFYIALYFAQLIPTLLQSLKHPGEAGVFTLWLLTRKSHPEKLRTSLGLQSSICLCLLRFSVSKPGPHC